MNGRTTTAAAGAAAAADGLLITSASGGGASEAAERHYWAPPLPWCAVLRCQTDRRPLVAGEDSRAGGKHTGAGWCEASRQPFKLFS